MKTVAIISEYNPFHNGHLYQIEKIREELGSDTAIIAIMSGNYTQRGEIAIMEKWERAKIAALCGVNLVLELPFPYSVSSAEFFARAGVSIAEKLGVEAYGVASDYHIYSDQASRNLREILARNKDFLTALFKPEPTYLGDKISLDGSGDVTNDY